MLSSGDKKALAIIAGVVVVFVAVVGTAVGVLAATSPSHKDSAYVQLAVGDKLITVQPLRWCDLYIRDCDPPTGKRPTPHVPVDPDQTVLLSVSQEISDGPWNLTTLYNTPAGLLEVESPQPSGTTFSTALVSTPARALIGITITAASVVSAPDGSTSVARGVLAIDTSTDATRPK